MHSLLFSSLSQFNRDVLVEGESGVKRKSFEDVQTVFAMKNEIML